MGKCQLCLKEGVLQRSHLIPAGIYKMQRAKGEENPNPIVIGPELAVSTSRQVAQPLLCHGCEQRFSEGGERYIIPICAHPDGGFPLREELLKLTPFASKKAGCMFNVTDSAAIDQEKCTYFALSVFWRAGVVGWKIQDRNTLKIRLGAYLEPLRSYLLGEGPLPTHVALSMFVTTGTQFMTCFPHSGPKNPYYMHSFAVPGIVFYLNVGNRVPQLIREVGITPPSGAHVFLGAFENSKHFESFRQLARDASPRGSLRKRNG